MRKFIIAGIIIIFASVSVFGQDGKTSVYFGTSTPVYFFNPEYKYFVGDIEKERWNFGTSLGYSVFSEKDSTSKFTYGAYLSISFSKLRSVELVLDTATEFDYYGIATVQDDYAVTNATVSGGAFNGTIIMFELQPSVRWYPSSDNMFVQAGINFNLLNRVMYDKIHDFTDENTKYVQSGINAGISIGGGYNYKMFTIAPAYKFVFVNNMFHYGSIMIGVNF